MGALPTGYGKSLPMLVTGLLMPRGIYVNLRTLAFTFEDWFGESDPSD